MNILPSEINRLVSSRVPLFAIVCLDPAMLRTNLENLQGQLNLTAQTLSMSEMSIAQDSAVKLEVQLVPFLRDADAFFRFARERIPQLREIVRAALALIGSSGSTAVSSVLFQCQNAGLIRDNLSHIDQRLAALNQALRQLETTYSADASRIAQGIQRRLTPPIIPIEENPFSPPRRQTVAEQTALAAVRLARQEVAALPMLVQAALGEIIRSGLVRYLPNFRM